MDNHSLEQRVSQLEKELAFWKDKFKRAGEKDSIRFVELELKVERLMRGLTDVDRIEKIASDAYVKSHPRAQETILEIDRTVDMGSQDLYFDNLPSVKNAKS
jgi:hypothetical protein